MVLPTTGPLTFSQIRGEFGGDAPDTLSEYYRGGANVPDLTAGRAEVQTVTSTGTRSNVVDAGQTEMITIGFDPAFDGGTGTTAAYDFDIDRFGTHFPGSPGFVEIDCTDATGDGGSGLSSRIRQNLLGSWRTDSHEVVTIDQPTDASTIAETIFNEASTSLRADATVRRGTGLGTSFVEDATGLVIRIDTTDDGFTFWMTDNSNDRVFTWDGPWGVIPTIYVDGVEYPTVDTDTTPSGTLAATAGNIHNLVGVFPENTNTGLLAVQHLSTQIEATYDGVTVSDPEFITGLGGIVDIDCTNATTVDRENGRLGGDWRTDNNEIYNFSSAATSEEVADEFFSEANSSLRSDITVSRGTGIGDSFIETSNGLVVRVMSATNRFDLWIADSGSNNFSWGPDWGVIPTIYADGVEYSGEGPVVVGRDTRDQIVVDTGISDNVSDASLSITANSGVNTQPVVFTVTDGVPGAGSTVHSTYLLHDYSNTQLTMFTGSVTDAADSDLATVLSTIETFVDDNTETPTNFTAAISGSDLILTADNAASIAGTWTVTAQHTTGDGDLSFSTARTTRGLNVGTNGNIPISGPIDITDFHGGDNGE